MTSAEDVSVVAEWLGEAGVRDVNGTVPIAADRLSYFSVVLADWTPVSAAYLLQASPNW